MDAAEAEARLKSMVAADADPKLTNGEVAMLVEGAARADKYGLAPSDTGWLGDYDLNAAAAEGWRWKAAKVAGNFSFAVDGDNYSEAQVHAACLQMAERYDAKVKGSASIVDNYGTSEYVVGNRAI